MEDESVGTGLVTLLSRRGGGRTGHGAASELIDWANAAVEAGMDGGALCQLAGETAPHYSSEVDELLVAVLDELDLPEPADQDSLLDAEMLILCAAVEAGGVDSDEALNRACQIVIDAGYPRRFGAWIEIIEDAAIVVYGDHPVLIEGLTRGNIAEHVHRIARETLSALTPAEWVRPYLALDASRGSSE